jgi:hypothetical protein
MGHTAKLDRAREHLAALRAETSEWVGEPSGDPPFELASEPPVHRIVYTGKAFPAERFGVLIGDVVQNLRQSLDHLVFELSQAYSGRLSESQASNSEFPVFGPQAPTPAAMRRRVGACCPCAQRAIAELQPSQLGDPGYLASGLWKLHELGRIDKHRLILPTVLKNTEGILEGPIDYVWSYSSYPQLQAGAEIARLTVLDPGGRPPTRMALEVDVAFGDGPAANESVSGLLEALTEEIEAIEQRLAILLETHDHASSATNSDGA